MNLEPFGIPVQPIVVSQPIVLNPFAAERMARVLAAAIQRHEALFGVLETEIVKRQKQRMKDEGWGMGDGGMTVR